MGMLELDVTTRAVIADRNPWSGGPWMGEGPVVENHCFIVNLLLGSAWAKHRSGLILYKPKPAPTN